MYGADIGHLLTRAQRQGNACDGRKRRAEVCSEPGFADLSPCGELKAGS